MTSLASADERCGDRVDEALFRVESWEQLARWSEKYPACDDGYFAEHISTLVGTWLAKRPSTLPALRKAIARRPAFEAVVLRHIDETLGRDTTEKIRTNADRRCPAETTTLCRRIIEKLDELD
jgi:hypothetical protein